MAGQNTLKPATNRPMVAAKSAKNMAPNRLIATIKPTTTSKTITPVIANTAAKGSRFLLSKDIFQLNHSFASIPKQEVKTIAMRMAKIKFFKIVSS